MFKLLKEIPLHISGIILIAMNVVTIVIHISVLTKALSFKLINGGRTASFDEAKKQSSMAIVLLLVLSVMVAFFAELTGISIIGGFRIATLVFLILFELTMLFSLVLQLLGTKFEKCVTSIIVFINLIMGLRLILEYSGK